MRPCAMSPRWSAGIWTATASVEIPTQPDEAGLLNLSQSRRMDFIVWMDYTSPEPEKSFGLLDEETNCYIELPMPSGRAT